MREKERSNRDAAYEAAAAVQRLHAEGKPEAAALALPELGRLVRNLRMQSETRKEAGDVAGYEERRAAYLHFNAYLKGLRRGALPDFPHPYAG